MRPAFTRMLRLQVLLAIAQGAFILTPEWVTASLEAGRWLPEAKFISKVHPASCPSFQPRPECAALHIHPSMS